MVKRLGKKFGLLALKILVVVAAFYYVINNTDFEKIEGYIAGANIIYLAIAVMIFLMMKYVMSLRLRNIIARDGEEYQRSYLFKTLMSGFFLNLALPGFVGGDGYVAYRLRKEKKVKLKTSIKNMLNSRANGFFALCCFLYIFFLSSGFANLVERPLLIVGSIFVLQVLVYYLFCKYYFKESLSQFFATSIYSILIQVMGACMVCAILYSIGVVDHFIEYISMFYFSESIAMMPITPMGLGVREFIFLNAAEEIGVYPEKAVAISMIVFGVFVATALVGLIFYFSNKNEEKENGST